MNSFPALIVFTVVAGLFTLFAGGGIGGALIAMATTFILVGWFGPKALVFTLIGALWVMFVEIVKAVNPLNER